MCEKGRGSQRPRITKCDMGKGGQKYRFVSDILFVPLPDGSISRISLGKAILEHPVVLPQCFIHDAALSHATASK